MHGFLDRFEGDLAVILVEEEKTEFTLARELLPEGSGVGTVFHLEKNVDNYIIKSINRAETEDRKVKSSSLLNKLQSKKKKSRFKR